MSGLAFEDVFCAATGFDHPYEWQRKLAERGEPASVIDVPTGAGKTEACLLDWLWRRVFHPDPATRATTPRRLVLALPMRVLVEQTRNRIQEALSRLRDLGYLDAPIETYVLMGGAADDSWTLEPAAETVLVGTIDMLLSRALNRGFGRGRSQWPIDFGLLGSDCVWVLDEVQLMDAAVATSAQFEAFRARFRTAAPCRTVWMSATLHPEWLVTRDHPRPGDASFARLSPEDRKGPLGPRLGAQKLLVREELDPTAAGDVAEVILREHETVLDRAEGRWLTLAMSNTVKRATSIYDALRTSLPGDTDLVLLHSRFRPPDRERLVARLGEAPPGGGRIVVSTQVIEAGVDLDAGALVTEIAPWASVVQRAGRLNRAGERAKARLVWLDPGELALEKLAPPYEPEELLAARVALDALTGTSLSPDTIEDFLASEPGRADKLLGRRPLSVLLRAPDLLDLFDTDPTLDGDDPDVGKFIRASEDLDVGVAWRDLGTDGPAIGDPLPSRAEVCPVPISQRKGIATLRPVWRWSYPLRRWEQLRESAIRPGDVLLVNADLGGYDPQRGWTGKRGPRVEPIEPANGDKSEGDADDHESAQREGRWISLVEHTEHVVDQVERLVGSLTLEPEWADALRRAARVHDVGKAHEEFQRRLQEWAGEEPPSPGPWAKAPERVRKRFRTFRHELVSALVLFEHNLDLAAYIVAAHHGKLRLTPRLSHDDHDPERPTCLGVRQGDEVPEVEVGGGEHVGPLTVDLARLRIGSLDGATWIERMLDLRDQLGPFRLAYVEALLRAADQRASKLEREAAAT